MLVKRSAQVLLVVCAALVARMPQRKPRLTRLFTHRYPVIALSLHEPPQPTAEPLVFAIDNPARCHGLPGRKA